MKNSNNTYVSIGLLIFGIFLGWIIFGFNSKKINNEVVLDKNLNTRMEDLTGNMMEDLQNKKGDDFDKAFLEYMATHEWGDINIAGMAMDNSSNENIRSFAGYILSSTASNMDAMEKLQSKESATK